MQQTNQPRSFKMSITYYELANSLLHKYLADTIIYYSDKERYSDMVNAVIDGHESHIWSDSVGAITAVVSTSLVDGVDRQEISVDRATALLDKLVTALNK